MSNETQGGASGDVRFSHDPAANTLDPGPVFRKAAQPPGSVFLEAGEPKEDPKEEAAEKPAAEAAEETAEDTTKPVRKQEKVSPKDAALGG